MPSTNKLSSHRLRSNSWHHVSGSLAKFLLSFCGIASFGVFTILVALSATFSVSMLSNNSVSALSTVSNQVNVTIPGSIALRLLDSTATAEIDSLSFDLTPVASGASATKRTIVDVATSNPTGYKLYMQSNYQKDGNYTTNLIHQDASVTDSIPTSTSASTLYWNYNNPLTSTTNPIPAHGTPDKIGQYFSPTNSNQTPLDVNVSVDTSIVAGTYENQLLFSAVGNPTTIAYELDFNTGSGTMAGEDIEETAAAWTHSITIPGNPSTNNYTDYIPTGVNALFTGWTISIPAGSSTTASCNGSSICHPGDTINITGGVNQSGDMVGEVTLTANYVSISTMQAMTPTICNTATIGASTALTDTRDNKTYTIRKLKDNNCWMTQNLDFLPTAGTTISSTTSNVALTTTLQTTDSTKSNYLTDDCSNANIDKYCTAYSDNAEHPEYGTYYNWYAATAGTGTSDLASTNATSSICPKGWRLPTGGEGGEFQVLYNNYGPNYYDSMTDVNGPHFVLNGYRNGTDANNQGATGNYWSSSAYTGGTNANFLYLRGSDSRVTPVVNSNKRNGLSLRCLAHDDSYSILGVDPNGGTWNGSTKGQTFAGTAGETKTISNPTTGPTYNISFDMSTSGMPAPANTTVARPFTSWSLSGAGSFAGGTYTYGAGNGTLTAQYSTTSNTFTLPSINNGFAGTCKWAEGSPTGTQYNIGVSRTVTGDTTYYAVCTMQAMTTSICSNAAIDTMATLTDVRDNNTYSVRKLKDSKCWMTQNLRIVGPRTLTSADSNVTTSYTLPAINSGTWCTSFSDPTCTDQSNIDYKGDTTFGAYYNWFAATAGTGKHETSTLTTASVCPKGWRLPTGKRYNSLSDGEFGDLYSYYNSDELMQGEPAFVLAGVRYGSDLVNVNQTGSYQSASGQSYLNRQGFLNIGVISPGLTYKPEGFSVRCLAQ